MDGCLMEIDRKENVLVVVKEDLGRNGLGWEEICEAHIRNGNNFISFSFCQRLPKDHTPMTRERCCCRGYVKHLVENTPRVDLMLYTLKASSDILDVSNLR